MEWGHACARPLFDYYDLSVEFDRRIQPDLAELCRDSRWLMDVDPAKLADRLCFEVCPLELFPEEMVVEPGNVQVYKAKAERSAPSRIYVGYYTAYVPYRGDDELWHLYPYKIESGHHPDGEIFRHHLILESAAADAATAAAEFQRRIRHIEMIVAAQALRIAQFEESLPALVAAKLAELRATQQTS